MVEAAGYVRVSTRAAGYGAMVRDAVSGEVLAEAAEGIGFASPVATAYRAVRAGLMAAATVEAIAEVEVRTDSMPVVERLTGRADPSDLADARITELVDEAVSVAAAFGPDRVSFSWVPRDRNVDAVRLARQAADADAWGRPWVRTATVEVPVPEPESQSPGEPLAALVPPDPATTTVLVRIGETALSKERRFAGVHDGDLTEVGRGQARTVAELLFNWGDVDVVVCSGLRPAQQTAQIIADTLDLSPVTEADLRETDFGDWEGLTYTEVQAGWPDELAAWLADPFVTPPGGESLADTETRIDHAHRELLGRFPHQTIVLVTHVTPIKTLTRLALEAPPIALHRMHLAPGSITEIDWYEQGAVVRALNDTRHLSPER